MRESRLTPGHTTSGTNVPIRGVARVLENRSDGNGYKLRLEVPDWPGSAPGQFLMLGAGAVASVPRFDPLLPRPMAVYRDSCQANPASSVTSPAPEGGESATPIAELAEIEVLYRVAGRGTTLLSEAEPGQTVSVVGPLGRGFPLESDSGPALLVGGGTGIASLYELSRALLASGRSVTVMLGARSGADLIGREDFEALDSTLVCTTEDGSLGQKGLVTAPLAERLSERVPGSVVYACGPTPMMRAAALLARGSRACAMLSCPSRTRWLAGSACVSAVRHRVSTPAGSRLVCRHGPVFDAHGDRLGGPTVSHESAEEPSPTSIDERVDFAGISLRNPVLTASGTFGYGTEFGPFLDLETDRRVRRQEPDPRTAIRESTPADRGDAGRNVECDQHRERRRTRRFSKRSCRRCRPAWS